MRRALLLSLLLWAGCHGEAIVDLTIGVDPSVPDAELKLVRSLTLDVSGLESATVRDAVTQPFPDRKERLVVRSQASGMVTLAVTARDAGGTSLLAGQKSFLLTTGRETMQSMTLSAVAPRPDGGQDLGVLDASAIDLSGTRPPDLLAAGCPPDVLLCDGFESGAIEPLRWESMAAPAGGTIAVDNTRAHRGQWSLHSHLDPVASGATATAEIGESHTFSPPGSTFFVRAWYYFASAGSATTATLIDAGQNVPPYKSVSLAVDHDALSVFDDFASPSVYTASTMPLLPLDTWTCVEWQIDTGTPNQLHAWIDGVKVTQLDLMEATTGTPPIGVIYFGLSMYPPNTSASAVDLWIDDVIFDHAPIGCAK